MATADELLRAMAHHVETRDAYTITFEKDVSGECRITYSFGAVGTLLLRRHRLVGVGPTPGLACKQVLDQLGLKVG